MLELLAIRSGGASQGELVHSTGESSFMPESKPSSACQGGGQACRTLVNPSGKPEQLLNVHVTSVFPLAVEIQLLAIRSEGDSQAGLVHSAKESSSISVSHPSSVCPRGGQAYTTLAIPQRKTSIVPWSL